MTTIPGAIRTLEAIASTEPIAGNIYMSTAIAKTLLEYIRELERKCEAPKTNGDHFDGSHG